VTSVSPALKKFHEVSNSLYAVIVLPCCLRRRTPVGNGAFDCMISEYSSLIKRIPLLSLLPQLCFMLNDSLHASAHWDEIDRTVVELGISVNKKAIQENDGQGSKINHGRKSAFLLQEKHRRTAMPVVLLNFISFYEYSVP
jgi:hypothetical protein